MIDLSFAAICKTYSPRAAAAVISRWRPKSLPGLLVKTNSTHEAAGQLVLSHQRTLTHGKL